MICSLHCLLFFGLFYVTAHGTVCGLTHCMKCEQGKCTECEYGWYGSHCHWKCQDQCWHGGCEQEAGICIQCTPGFYTVSCHKPCPHNCRVSYDKHRYCNRTTGYCLEGCNDSYWGFQCDQTCNENCQGTICDQNSGLCLEGCIDGWYEQTCNKICPENCHNTICSNFGGECVSCAHGFHGRMCNISCKNCFDEECNVNELDQSIECTKGCKDGWTSTDCKCSNKCRDEKCGINGRCETCSEGYYGDRCDNKCLNDCTKCDRTGICIEISTSNKRSTVEGFTSTNVGGIENVSAAPCRSVVVMCASYLMAQVVILHPSGF